MKKLIVLLSLSQIIIAQEPLDYWPFHEGDIWQYRSYDGEIYNRSIIKDSVDSYGNHHLTYKIEYLNQTGSRLEFVIVDTTDKIWQYDSDYLDSVLLKYDLRKNLNEWFFIGYIGEYQFRHIIDTGSTQVLGVVSKYRKYEAYLAPSETSPPDSMYLQLGISQLATGYGLIYQDSDGYYEYLSGAIINGENYGTIVGIENKTRTLPPKQSILINTYPNPFNSQVILDITLTSSRKINLNIYNILGKEVKYIYSGNLGAGNHSWYWDGTNQNSNQVVSGIYILTLVSDDHLIQKKLLYLK